MEPPPLGSILIRRAYDPRDPAMASGNNDDIQNLNAFLGGWSAAVARMAIPSDATLRGSSQGASAVDLSEGGRSSRPFPGHRGSRSSLFWIFIWVSCGYLLVSTGYFYGLS